EISAAFGGELGEGGRDQIVSGNRVCAGIFRYHEINSASKPKMYTVMRDIGHALRVLLRSPGYTAATLLSLGLGIGANTAIFTVTNATLLHSLPVTDPESVLELYTVDHATQGATANPRSPISLLNIVDVRKQNEVFSGVAAFAGAGVTMTGFGKPTQE